MARPTQKLPADARQVGELLEVLRRQAQVVDAEPPLLVRPQAVGEVQLAAVHLRPVPPVGVARDIRRRPARIGARVGLRAQDLHRVLGPRVVLLERDLPGVGQLRIVAQPVVHLELDPGPGQQVERGRGLEGLAREEPAADQPRVRVEQPLRIVRVGVLQRHVSPEPAPERAHERIVEVVVGAVDHPRTQVAARRRDPRTAACRAARGPCRRGSWRGAGRAARSGRGSRRSSAAAPSRTSGRPSRPNRRQASTASPSPWCPFLVSHGRSRPRLHVLAAMKHPGRVDVKSPWVATRGRPAVVSPIARSVPVPMPGGRPPPILRACGRSTQT